MTNKKRVNYRTWTIKLKYYETSLAGLNEKNNINVQIIANPDKPAGCCFGKLKIVFLC